MSRKFEAPDREAENIVDEAGHRMAFEAHLAFLMGLTGSTLSVDVTEVPDSVTHPWLILHNVLHDVMDTLDSFGRLHEVFAQYQLSQISQILGPEVLGSIVESLFEKPDDE